MCQQWKMGGIWNSKALARFRSIEHIFLLKIEHEFFFPLLNFHFILHSKFEQKYFRTNSIVSWFCRIDFIGSTKTCVAAFNWLFRMMFYRFDMKTPKENQSIERIISVFMVVIVHVLVIMIVLPFHLHHNPSPSRHLSDFGIDFHFSHSTSSLPSILFTVDVRNT